jgi:spore germination cell wall hydrolase CwlJ-like protein
MLKRTILMAPVAFAVAAMRPATLPGQNQLSVKSTIHRSSAGDLAESRVPDPVVRLTPPTEPPKPESASATLAQDSHVKASRSRHSRKSDKALRCLALNVYHEARSEPVVGQVAVAAVTLNRVASGAFPDSVCGVVEQGGQERNHCQFSWWCDGRTDAPRNKEAWQEALRVSLRALTGKAPDPTGGALFYHTTSVHPRWSRTFERTARIGRHLFYKPGRAEPLRLASAG